MLHAVSMLFLLSAAPQTPPAGFHGIAQLHSSVVGPFSFLGSTLEVAPQFGFGVGDRVIAVGARMSAGFEWTAPDNPTGRRWGYSDLGLVLSAPQVLRTEDATFSFTPSIGATAPISIESRWRGLITTPMLQLRGDALFERFRASARLDVVRPIYSQPENPPTGPIFVCQTDRPNCGLGMPATATVAPRLLGEYVPIETLSVGADFSLFYEWRLLSGASSRMVDSNGNPVVAQTGPRVQRSLSFYSTWRFHPMFGATAELGSDDFVYGADNRSITVPFLSGATWITASVFVRTDAVLDPRWFAP